MSIDSQEYKHTLEETTRTDGHTVTYDVSWKIPHFFNLMYTQTMAREFPTHKKTVVEAPISKYQIKMSFLGHDNELMQIAIKTITPNFHKINLFIQSKKYGYNKDYFYMSKANEWQFYATFTTIVLKKFCFEQSILNLNFVIEVFQKAEDDCNNVPTPKLSDDFRRLLSDGSYADIVMKSAEGVEFSAHKTIITIRSKVLKAHFDHNTIESVANVVQTNWETEVLREVLTFVYTDQCPRVDEYPEKLLAAADYYQLEGMKSICENVLCEKLTVENAVDTLQLAMLHSADSLTKSTLDFIKDGRSSLIIKTQGWANVQSVELLKRMYECIMANEIDNADILDSALKEVALNKSKNN